MALLSIPSARVLSLFSESLIRFYWHSFALVLIMDQKLVPGFDYLMPGRASLSILRRKDVCAQSSETQV